MEIYISKLIQSYITSFLNVQYVLFHNERVFLLKTHIKLTTGSGRLCCRYGGVEGGCDGGQEMIDGENSAICA